MGVVDTFKSFRAAVLALLLAGALPGCAVYEKCGFGGCPGDAKISADVRALLSQHPGAAAPGAVSVQTLDGVVYLYGVVDTDLMREQAGEIALQAPHVKKVVNSIGVLNEGK
ncbi:MAG: BON domain-containing protein [Steroidobacteraceae bacterium]